MSVTAYIAYYRQVAMLHKIMQHDEVSEVFDAFPSTCHFRPFSTNEDFGVALPYTIADGASLHLDMGDRDLANDQLWALPGIYRGGFIITRKATPVDALAAWEETATIANDVLARMIDDYYESLLPLGDPDFKRLRIDPVGPIWADRYGWRVSFRYSIQPPKVAADEVKDRILNAFNTQVFQRPFEAQFQ